MVVDGNYSSDSEGEEEGGKRRAFFLFYVRKVCVLGLGFWGMLGVGVGGLEV
jgi:hypothetical protein